MEQDQIEQLRAEMEGRQLISEWKAEKRAFFSKPENVELDCAEIHDFLDGVAQKAALEEIQMHGRVTSTPDEILKKSYAKMLETVKRRQNAKKPKQAEGKSESRDMTPDDYMAKQREHINRIRNPRLGARQQIIVQALPHGGMPSFPRAFGGNPATLLSGRCAGLDSRQKPAGTTIGMSGGIVICCLAPYRRVTCQNPFSIIHSLRWKCSARDSSF